MKKLITLGLIVGAASGLAACGDSEAASINVYTRDTTSGTREGFFAAIGASDAKRSNDYLVDGVAETSGNGDMISKIKNDNNGIGYISLTSLSDSGLKGLDFDGVEATKANVLNETYGMARDFGYVTIATPAADVTQVELLVAEFNLFLNSKDGEFALGSAGVIVDETSDYNYTPTADVCNGTETDINFGGSTSVESAAKALSTALSNECSAFKPVHAHTGSGDSENVAKEGQTMHIGFSSSGMRDGWVDGTVQGVLGQDAIVAVVNEENELDNITKEQLQEVFVKHDAEHEGEAVAANTKNITKWEDLM